MKIRRSRLCSHAIAIIPLLINTFTAKYTSALIIPLSTANPAVSLNGITVPRVSDGKQINLGKALEETGVVEGDRRNKKVMLILGGYPGDFNTVEYAQKVRYFLPQLREKGIDRIMMVINGEPSSCRHLAELLDLPIGGDESIIELFSDPTGEAGRRFGVSRGFRPDAGIPAQLKLFCMGIGIGPPWNTLPAVLTGYFGDPNGKRDWIEASLKQGQLAGRWPPVLELNDQNDILKNAFDDAPLVGSSWGRRPFELATLRLQNLIGIQMKHADRLKHVDERCLTQLGGCTVVGSGGDVVFSWIDQGLCDVPDMEQLLEGMIARAM